MSLLIVSIRCGEGRPLQQFHRQEKGILMPRQAQRKTEAKRTIHHTVSGGHSVDRAELLGSERVQNVISEVAQKLKVSRTAEPQPPAPKPTA